MKHGTGFIQPEDRHALNLLRLKEFQKSPGLKTYDASAFWNALDESADVMGVWRSGELVATMRLEILPDLHQLMQKIEVDFSKEEILFPVGVLNKAATLPSLQNSGLNAHLRYYLLRLAMQKGVKKIYGTLVKGAPQSKALEDMGYKFCDHSASTAHALAPFKVPVQFISLDLATAGNRALSVCARLAAETLLLYPWMNPKRKDVMPVP